MKISDIYGMSDTFIENQIVETENQITALNGAITFLYANPHKRYSLDTGQTKQDVVREDLIMLQQQVDMLLNRRSTLQALCRGAAIKINPGF